MYLIGAAHRHKTESQLILEKLIAARQRIITDAEVLQEILHRYTAINRREATGPALKVTLDIVDEVIAIEKTDVLRAGEIVEHRMFDVRPRCHPYRGHGATRNSIDTQLR